MSPYAIIKLMLRQNVITRDLHSQILLDRMHFCHLSNITPSDQANSNAFIHNELFPWPLEEYYVK